MKAAAAPLRSGSDEDGRLLTTFMRPLQTQFYVPDCGSKCAAKRLIDFSLNPPLSEEAELRELKSAAESLVCAMHCSVDGQKRYFHMRVKTEFPLKTCHLLLRSKYLCKEGAWKELSFHSKLSVWSQCEVTLFWVRKGLVQRDANYRDRYRILVDFDLVHCDWLPPESPFYATRGIQVNSSCGSNSASPKKVRQAPSVTEERHHPDSNLVLEVADQRLHTFCDLLTVASPVFAKILSQAADDRDSSGRKVVRLPGKSAVEVEELLKLLQLATPHRLSLRMAPAILILSDEYQIDHIKDTAEGLIVRSYAQWEGQQPQQDSEAKGQPRRPCPMEGYALARTYHCPRLEAVCLGQLMPWRVDQIESNAAFRCMDTEDRCSLAMARMKLMEKGSAAAAGQ